MGGNSMARVFLATRTPDRVQAQETRRRLQDGMSGFQVVTFYRQVCGKRDLITGDANI